MPDTQRNLGRTGAKSMALSKAARPSTKTPKPAKKVFGPSSQPARAKVGVNQ